ncbi:FdtA/QdtA family cupin domain-containing protein [Sungkyunkwania multivorans]|uniref:FdtA/QdtA family cupin domain-containing protein n=1 Tax=Sungkyunkwania multivorans TaxID=1173618 RepID=A0ABW3CSE2_9FLAO
MLETTIEDIKDIQIPKVEDLRGNLAIVEGDSIPFEMKRVYYLYDVPSSAYRGGHAHRSLEQVMIALSGSFDVIFDDGKQKKTITLNKPDRGILIPPGIWREMVNFSSGAVCMVIASEVYDEEDYIRAYSEFQSLKNT